MIICCVIVAQELYNVPLGLRDLTKYMRALFLPVCLRSQHILTKLCYKN